MSPVQSWDVYAPPIDLALARVRVGYSTDRQSTVINRGGAPHRERVP